MTKKLLMVSLALTSSLGEIFAVAQPVKHQVERIICRLVAGSSLNLSTAFEWRRPSHRHPPAGHLAVRYFGQLRHPPLRPINPISRANIAARALTFAQKSPAKLMTCRAARVIGGMQIEPTVRSLSTISIMAPDRQQIASSKFCAAVVKCFPEQNVAKRESVRRDLSPTKF